MDIADIIGSDDIQNNLKVSDFHIDDNGMVYMWVQKTGISQLIPPLADQFATPSPIPPSTTVLNINSTDESMHSITARRLMREHMPKSHKSEIQKMVVDIFSAGRPWCSTLRFHYGSYCEKNKVVNG